MTDQPTSPKASGERRPVGARPSQNHSAQVEPGGGLNGQRLETQRIAEGPVCYEPSLDLALLGFLLAGSVVAVRTLRPDIPWIWPLLTGLGGAYCILVALQGRGGSRIAKLGTLIALGATASVLLTQTALYWNPPETTHPGAQRLAILTMVLTVFCLGTFRNLVRGSNPNARSAMSNPSPHEE